MKKENNPANLYFNPVCKYWLILMFLFLTIASGFSQTICGPSQWVKLNSPATITIDGIIDTTWAKVSPNVVNNVTVANNTTQKHFAAQWKGMWDNNYLYLLVQVKDSALRVYQGTDSIFNFDAVEIFLDGNNSRTLNYNGVNDFQYLFSYYASGLGVKTIGKGPNDPSSTDISNITYAVNTVSDGYNMEIRIPWSTNTTGSASHPDVLGFDINVDDNSHNLGKRDEQIQWSNSSTEDYNDPQLFASTPLVDCNPIQLPSPTVTTCGPSQMAKLNSGSISIDGVVDTVWAKVSSNVINKVTVANSTTQKGFAAQWKGMWDSKNLYLLVQVKDSALRPYLGSDSVFNFDAVEIFLDGNHSRTANYNGVNDFQYLFSYYLGAGGKKVIRKGPNDPAGTDTTGIQYAVSNTSDGYNMEISIPWSTYTTGSASRPDTVGFDINVDDNSHNLGKRDEQIQWTNSSTEDYNQPQLFGTVPLVDCNPVQLPPPTVTTCGPSQMAKLNSGSISIDGVVDTVWAKVSSNVINKVTVANSTTQKGFAAQWKGMWDSKNLYLLVQVKDSALRPYLGSDSVFNFDAVEIFLDGNHSRTANYNGVNDFQYLFSYYLGAGGKKVIRKGPNDPAGSDTTGIQYAISNTSDGYNMEISIPWSTYTTGSASRPDTVGFDINVDDNSHNLGKRDEQIQWTNSSTEDYNQPQLFGTVPLVDCNPVQLPPPTVTTCGPSQMAKLNSGSISIDGVVDTVWAKVSSNVINKVTVANSTTQKGFAAQWKGMWDSKNLYLLVQVKDSALRPYLGSDSVFNFDAVEIFLDGNHSRTANYNGVNDFQYLFSYYLGAGGKKVIRKGPNDPAGSDTTGIQYAISNTSDGYNMEISIPWSTYTTGSASRPDTVGFDINVDDNSHNLGKRDEQIQWTNSSTEDYNQPQLFGTVPLVDCNPVQLPPPTVTTCGPSQMAKLNSGSISIDGVVDTVWAKVSSNVINKVTVANSTTQKGFAAQWKGMWDSKNLYLLVQVKDSALRPYLGSDSVFNFDAVEIFLDGNHSRTANYNGVNDFQYLFGYYLGAGGKKVIRKGPNDPAGTDTTGIQYAISNTSDGYNMEISIPWSTYTTGSASRPDTVGFDINVDDNSHNLGKRDEQIQWTNSSTEDYNQPQLFGTVPLVDCNPVQLPPPTVTTCGPSQIVKLNGALTIDGAVDTAWGKVSPNFITHTTVGTPQSGYKAQWKGMWDNNYLYFLVQITDSTLRPYHGTDSVFNFDAVEIFLDGNNSRTPNYNGTNDFQYLFSYYLDGGVQVIRKGPNDPAGTDTSKIIYFVQKAPGGYNMEIRIPWSTYTTGSASRPDTLGFDINVDDNAHNGGKRDAQLQWNNSSTEDYNNPQLFGVTPLVDCNPAPITITVTYPNPVTNPPGTPPNTIVPVDTTVLIHIDSIGGCGYSLTYTPIKGGLGGSITKTSYSTTDTLNIAGGLAAISSITIYDSCTSVTTIDTFYLPVKITEVVPDSTTVGNTGNTGNPGNPGNPSGPPTTIITTVTGTGNCGYSITYTPIQGGGTDTSVTYIYKAGSSSVDTLKIPGGVAVVHSIAVYDSCTTRTTIDTFYLPVKITEVIPDSTTVGNPNNPGNPGNPSGPPTTIITTVTGAGNCGYSITYTPIQGGGTDTSVTYTYKAGSPSVDTLKIPGGIAVVHSIAVYDSCTMRTTIDTFYLPVKITEVVPDSTTVGNPGNTGTSSGPPTTIITTVTGTGNCGYSLTYTPIQGGTGAPITFAYSSGSISKTDTLRIPGGVAAIHTLTVYDSCTKTITIDTFYLAVKIIETIPDSTNGTTGTPGGGFPTEPPTTVITTVSNIGNCGYSITYTPIKEEGTDTSVTFTYKAGSSGIDTLKIPGGIAVVHSIAVYDSCTKRVTTDTFYLPLKIYDCLLTDSTIKLTITNGYKGPYNITYTPNYGTAVNYKSLTSVDSIVLPQSVAASYTIWVMDSSTLQSVIATFYVQPKLNISDSILNDTTTLLDITGGNRYTCSYVRPIDSVKNCVYKVTYTPIGGGTPVTVSGTSLNKTKLAIPAGIAGSYILELTDSCTGEYVKVIVDPPSSGPLALVNDGSTGATCNGNDGTIKVKASGGKLPYSYSYTFNGGALIPSPSRAVITGLSPGSYMVTVTDGSSARVTIPVTISPYQQHSLTWKHFKINNQ